MGCAGLGCVWNVYEAVYTYARLIDDVLINI